MDIQNAFEILVVILSITLFISLIIWIVVGVLVVKFMKVANEVAEKGERFVEHAEDTVSSIRQNVSAAGVIQAVTHLVKVVSKSNKKG